MNQAALPADPRLHAICRAYEALTPHSVEALAALYSADARFQDPFNHVQGRDAITSVFSHMFKQVQAPRFQVDTAAVHGDAAFLSWTMSFSDLKKPAQGALRSHITGCTRLRFDAGGLITEHIDFWDPAAQLYEQVPILGSVLRWVRRRLAAPACQTSGRHSHRSTS